MTANRTPRRLLAWQTRHDLTRQGVLDVPGLAEAAAESHDNAAGLAAADVQRQAHPRIFDLTELCRRPLFAGTEADPQRPLFSQTAADNLRAALDAAPNLDLDRIRVTDLPHVLPNRHNAVTKGEALTMGIKRKEQKPEPQLPADLQTLAEAALVPQVASKYFEKKYADAKSVFFGAVEATDEITLTVGESFRFRSGLFRWQERANPQVDTAKLAEAIQSGHLAIEAVLACVSKFNAESIAALLPDAVSDGTPTAFGVMQANPEFKAQVEGLLEQAIVALESEPARVAA